MKIALALLLLVAACAYAATPTKKADHTVVFSGRTKYLVIPVECYDTFVLERDFTNLPCIKQTLSKGIGYVIVVAAAILKVPQMLIILRAKDVSGISFLSQYFELLAFTTSAIYNALQGNPISTYGENLLIMLQTAVIIVLMWQYAKGQEAKSITHIMGVSVLYLLIVYAMVNSPKAYLPYFFWFVLGCTISGRVPQVLSNFVNMHTGQSSFITNFLMFGGSIARIFTTLQEVSDPYILYGFLVGGALNFILVAQILIFWSNTNKFLKQTLAKKFK